MFPLGVSMRYNVHNRDKHQCGDDGISVIDLTRQVKDTAPSRENHPAKRNVLVGAVFNNHDIRWILLNKLLLVYIFSARNALFPVLPNASSRRLET